LLGQDVQRPFGNDKPVQLAAPGALWDADFFLTLKRHGPKEKARLARMLFRSSTNDPFKTWQQTSPSSLVYASDDTYFFCCVRG